jgi:hypothetical protein
VKALRSSICSIARAAIIADTITAGCSRREREADLEGIFAVLEVVVGECGGGS